MKIKNDARRSALRSTTAKRMDRPYKMEQATLGFFKIQSLLMRAGVTV